MNYREYWKPLSLTPSGLPVYLQSEVDILKKKNVRIIICQGATLGPGELTLTTHRMLYDDSVAKLCLALSDVGDAQQKPSRFMASSKLFLFLVGQAVGAEPAYTVDFKKGSDRDEFFRAVMTARERCAWVQVSTINQAPHSFGTSGAGITGILRRRQQQQQHLNSLSTAAFGDLDSLIAKAKEVVAVINRYTAYKEQQRAHEDGEQSAKDEEEASGLRDALATIGYVNPVTKETAGTEFHNTLARQVADFLSSRKLLEGQGGMITLHDLYCVYNRARGTELVSPDDLLKACEILKSLGLGMSLRTFSSAVTVVQSDVHDNSQMSTRLKEMAEESTYLTPMAVSSRLKISIVVSHQHLLLAEQGGYLCRDEDVQGLLFYPNLFSTFQ